MELGRVVLEATPRVQGPRVTVSFDLDTVWKEAPGLEHVHGGAPNIAECDRCKLLVRYDRQTSTVRIDAPSDPALWFTVTVPRRAAKRPASG